VPINFRPFVSALSRAGTAARAAARPVGAVYRTYNKATTPLATHMANKLPEAYRPFAKGFVGGAGLTMTGVSAAGAYESAANAAGNSARQLAQTSGLRDPKQLDTVSERARSRMIPMAWKSVAPKWLGGDGTPLGREIAQDVRSVAWHNIGPAVLRPAPSAAKRHASEAAFLAATGNPISAVSPYLFAPRPTVAQMWQNVPQNTRSRLKGNLAAAALQPTSVSPLAQEMRYVFAPVAAQYGL
jgi:hypothetical protein